MMKSAKKSISPVIETKLMKPIEDNRKFIETIRMEDGVLLHPEDHLARMRATVEEACGRKFDADTLRFDVPLPFRKGVVKCRILYSAGIGQVDFAPYTPRIVKSLRLVDGGDIDYHLKYADRSRLDALRALRGNCDDVLITVDGRVTDTSYSNVVLSDGERLYTPDTYLLNGTMRQRLLREGLIEERKICREDLSHYKSVTLINAMLGIEAGITLSAGDISS